MLRREFLSIFRSVCDSKMAHYKNPVRLRRTAAAERRWAANLLLLCESDLKKPWSGTISVSDACLSGTATCHLEENPATVQSIACTRELWRYKGKHATVKARDAIQKLDPFSDIRTVLKDELFDDPFQLNEKFQNVPQHLACSDDWKLQFASPMHFKEHITVLEGRATLQSITHKVRSSHHLDKRHLHLGDNLGMVLAFDRGRAKSPQLLLCCRKACAYSIASGCIFSHRWLPSEFNAADGPSRTWEEEGEKGLSKSQASKVRDKILYLKNKEERELSSRFEARSRVSPGDPCFEASSPGRGSLCRISHHVGAAQSLEGEGPAGESETAGPDQECNQAHSSVFRSDNFGSFCSVPQHNSGLLLKNPRFSRLLRATGTGSHGLISDRPCVDRIFESSVLRRVGHRGGKQVLRSSSRDIPMSRKKRPVQKPHSPERLEKSGSRPIKDTTC